MHKTFHLNFTIDEHYSEVEEVLESPAALDVALGVTAKDRVSVMLCEATFHDYWLTDRHLNFTVIARNVDGFVWILASSHSGLLLSRHVLLLVVVVILLLLLLSAIAVIRLDKAS